MAAPSAKIVLKETTKMTLHERFSMYRQNNLVQPQIAMRQTTMAMFRQASIKNQRLAVQMANRPSVVAALKIKKRSLKQRLGMNGNAGIQRFHSNVKARLALGNRSNLHSRLGGNNFRNNRGRFFNRGFSRPGTSNMMKSRLGMNQNSFMDYRGLSRASSMMSLRQGQQSRQSNRGSNNRKGRGFNNRGNFNRQQQQSYTIGNNRFNRGRFQAKQWRFMGRGRSANFNQGKVPTKQDLDNDIDQYMAQTKNHLDAELDAYMAQTTE